MGLEYRLVKTATLVDAASQTGGASEIQVKTSGIMGSEVGIMDDAMERNNQNTPVSVPISSASSPIVVSSDSGKFVLGCQNSFDVIFMFFNFVGILT